MPTIEIAPYSNTYAEHADGDLGWEEWGTNHYGFRSHRRKPAYSTQPYPLSEQWHRGFSEGSHYLPFGLYRPLDRPWIRVLWCYKPEGPHESGGSIIYRVPVPRTTITEARLALVAGPYRVYGVAVDDFAQLQPFSGDYAITQRIEFYERHFQPGARRYRAESAEDEMPHTEAQAVSATGDELVCTEVVQEILARPGWKYGNRLCLSVRPWFDRDAVYNDWPIKPEAPPQFTGATDGNSYEDPANGPTVVLPMGAWPTAAQAGPPLLRITY